MTRPIVESRDLAAAALAAGATVVEQHRVAFTWDDGEPGFTTWQPASSGHAQAWIAETDELFPGRYADKRIERRWVITTEPVELPPTREDGP